MRKGQQQQYTSIVPTDNIMAQERSHYLKQIANLRKGFKTVIKNTIAEAKIKISKIVEQQFKKAMFVFNEQIEQIIDQFK